MLFIKCLIDSCSINKCLIDSCSIDKCWLSGTRVEIIISAIHSLVVEPLYHIKHCNIIGCELTYYKSFSCNSPVYLNLHCCR
jgi:hypothetical protein